jgi:hypothetical protein
MLDIATMVDTSHDRGYRGQGQDLDHRQSPHGDLASGITPMEERGRDQDNMNLHDVIRNRDAHDWIENRCQERDHIKH